MILKSLDPDLDGDFSESWIRISILNSLSETLIACTVYSVGKPKKKYGTSVPLSQFALPRLALAQHEAEELREFELLHQTFEQVELL